MNAQMLSLFLGIFGSLGTLFFLMMAGITFWRYRNSSTSPFRRQLRNQRLKQISAIACLFFLAMTASYTVLLEVWAIFYLVIAFKVGTWWHRLRTTQRS